ncbi:MAG: hypothetical protein DMD87_12390 [Candidatus Rokuibacteriota bacterium]|nr:MAG: hypothetical protein DMD87_12390 [Candidatus Rokubacteria bacterium]
MVSRRGAVSAAGAVSGRGSLSAGGALAFGGWLACWGTLSLCASLPVAVRPGGVPLSCETDGFAGGADPEGPGGSTGVVGSSVGRGLVGVLSLA